MTLPIHTYITKTQHDDQLFLAQLLVGFFGLMWLGELVYPDDPNLDIPRKMSKHSILTVTSSSLSFLLPYHKANCFFEGNRITVYTNPTAADPLATMKWYLISWDSLFPSHPDLWICRDGHRPCRRWFLQRLQNFLGPNVTGHSIRSGGATALAQLGIPLDLIQAMGCWSSDTFHIYIRSHPLLIHAAIQQNRA